MAFAIPLALSGGSMFKDLFIWWEEDILLKGALEGVKDMIEITKEMFDFATASFFGEVEEKHDIYEMDKSVNVLEVEIRKKVYEHLSMNPKQDITSSLVLTTIVIDIERIGDYSKNIYELSLIYTPESGTRCYEEAKRLAYHVNALLSQIGKAVENGDVESARKLMEEKNWICKKCEGIIKEIVIDEAIKVRAAVVYSLMFRYLKRASAHIGNIASSIVNPFYRIGFKPE